MLKRNRFAMKRLCKKSSTAIHLCVSLCLRGRLAAAGSHTYTVTVVASGCGCHLIFLSFNFNKA